MSISPRFVTNVSVMIAGAAVVVFSQAVRPGVTNWIALGVGLGILAAVGLAQLDRNRGLAQHAVDAVCGLLALWTVVVSAVYAGDTIKWLSFGEGLGFAALALTGSIVHELSTERVVHSLAIQEGQPSRHYTEAA